MSPSSTSIARALLGGLLAALTGTCVAAANPEPLDLEPDILAEIARIKAQSSTQARRSAGAGTNGKNAAPPAAECGALAIGNVVGNNRVGFAPVDINVVIVGDVINANNKCK